jgi:adenylate kinase
VNGFLLDGFPRTIQQAIDLDEMLESRDEYVTGVISLMIPDDEIKARIKGRALIEGRADDANDETIANRIRTYHEKTEPLIQIYKEKGIYHEINGLGTIEEVQKRVFDLMDTL